VTHDAQDLPPGARVIQLPPLAATTAHA
jgi:ABC-type uncharacterized transport system YnjBCD ATPase subunit